MISSTQQNSVSQPLLVLLIDSLRWDILTHFRNRTGEDLPGFSKLKYASAHVERVAPVFPAECFPNLISLLTGLYPIDHGATFTQLYDQNKDSTFHPTIDGPGGSVALDALKSNFNENKRMHLYHVPICSSLSSGPVSCDAYTGDQMTPERLHENLQTAISRLSNGSSHVAVVYYDRLDQAGHIHGPLSDELLRSELPALDAVVEQLVDVLLPVSSRSISLLVTSDHGMTEVRGTEFLDRYISPDLVKKVINRGSTVSIWPAEGQSHNLQRRLKSDRIERFTYHTRDQLPSSWRSGGPSFPPVLLVAKPGYLIQSNFWPIQLGHYPTPVDQRGAHGYGSSHVDMHVPLFVWGRHLHPGLLHNDSSWDQTDTHRLIMALTQTQPDLHATSSLSNVLNFLITTRNSTMLLQVLAVATVLILFWVLAVLLLTAWRSKCTGTHELEANEKLLPADLTTA